MAEACQQVEQWANVLRHLEMMIGQEQSTAWTSHLVVFPALCPTVVVRRIDPSFPSSLEISDLAHLQLMRSGGQATESSMVGVRRMGRSHVELGSRCLKEFSYPKRARRQSSIRRHSLCQASKYQGGAIQKIQKPGKQYPWLYVDLQELDLVAV